MNQSVFDQINSQKPKLIFLTGKTCTGKITLCNSLKDQYNCAVIELDKIIQNIESPVGVDKYVEIYRHRNYLEIVNLFISGVKEKIDVFSKEYDTVIIEGALANNETLGEIVNQYFDEFLFIYLLPINFDIYKNQIKSRFIKATEIDNVSLPPDFWECLPQLNLEKFYKTREIDDELEKGISTYTQKSMLEAKERLNMFEQLFSNIFIVEI